MSPAELEARMVEYVKLLNKEWRNGGASPPDMIHRQSSASPPNSSPGGLTAMEMSRLTLWNMHNNNTLYPGIAYQQPLSPQASNSSHTHVASPEPGSGEEPQREALNLGLR